MPQDQTEHIEIVVNGRVQTAPSGLNVASLLAALAIEGDRVAVELNRKIVRKSEWEATPVQDGATLEIVQFVGGG
jgi:thiamine biosynthesis protein ThiS